jgi:leucyl aminopeptidase (aminopeptidase T)
VIFGNNLLIDVESDHKLLKESIVEHVLEAAAEPVKPESK